MRDFTKHTRSKKGRILSSSTFCRSANALLILIPAFIFLSCSAEVPETLPLSEEKQGKLKLHISSESGWQDRNISGKAVDIFIFNDDGLRRIDSYQRLTTGNEPYIDAASRKGKKIVTAIVNPQEKDYEWNSISSFESVAGTYTDLRLEDPEFPLMSGVIHITATDDGSFDMPVCPAISEVYVRSIKCDFSDRPYHDARLENASAYLTNINSLVTLVPDGSNTPSAPMNTDGYPTESMKRMEHPEMVYAGFNEDIGTETIYPEIRLYCYPNGSEEDTEGTPFTRLVIAGDIEGRRYYYPLNINRGEFGMSAWHSGIERNCRYIFDITIRQTGVTDPCIPVSGETVTINGTVEPWYQRPETEIEF